MTLKVGIIHEGKVPADRRTPLTPEHVRELQSRYPAIQFVCQQSNVRCFSNEEYQHQNIPVVADVHDCDILLGVKEVPISQLHEGKTYLFFSHTIKKQAYNRELLRTILSRNIRLIDYEALTDRHGNRLVAFGRFAGIVGAYNALWTYGKRYALFTLRRAHECFDLEDLKQELKKVKLPPIKITLTGSGRVGNGAREILDAVGALPVTPQEFLTTTFKHPVYVQLGSKDYHIRKDSAAFDSKEFHQHPEMFVADFLKFTHEADVLIAGAYWNPSAPKLFLRSDMLSPKFKIRIIADITCDIEGSIPSTKKACSVNDPLYDYDASTDSIQPPLSHRDFVTVMAIDNLPSELPRDASTSFGRALSERVLPALLEADSEGIIARGTVAENGHLTESFAYLQGYVNGEATAS